MPSAQSGLQSLYQVVPEPVALLAVQVAHRSSPIPKPLSAHAITISVGSTVGFCSAGGSVQLAYTAIEESTEAVGVAATFGAGWTVVVPGLPVGLEREPVGPAAALLGDRDPVAPDGLLVGELLPATDG